MVCAATGLLSGLATASMILWAPWPPVVRLVVALAVGLSMGWIGGKVYAAISRAERR